MTQNSLQQQFVNSIPSLYPGASASYFDFGAALMAVSQSPPHWSHGQILIAESDVEDSTCNIMINLHLRGATDVRLGLHHTKL